MSVGWRKILKTSGGRDIGNINATLLQKVEELTLYIIQLNKKNEALEKRVAEMEKRKN